MIVGIWELNKIVIEVEKNVKIPDIVELLEHELDIEIEQISPLNGRTRAQLMTHQAWTVHNLNTGPCYSDNPVYLITYRKDMSKKIGKALEKLERIREAKAEETARIAEEAKEKERKDKVAKLKAELAALEPEVK